MLGHSDTRTTLDIYTHVLTNMQEPVTNAINDTFKDITVTNSDKCKIKEGSTLRYNKNIYEKKKTANLEK